MTSIWTGLLGVEFQQSYIDAGGIRTRAMHAGSGTPLILLHGVGGHAEAYARNLAAHADGCHAYAIDMIGHGYTDCPADAAYDLDTFVGHLERFVDAIGADKVYLSGESLGGMVASWFAIRHPDRVAKLVLNTGMLMTRDAEAKKKISDLRDRSRRATTELTRESVRARLNWLMHDPAKSVTEELVDVRYAIYSQPDKREMFPRIAGTVIGNVLNDDWAEVWLNPENMRRIQCPTLVLWTRHNPGLSVERAREGMTRLADARMVVLEDSSHWPQWEQADEFNRIHTQFLFG